MLSKVIAHARDRDYMSGVERDKARIKATGEVFTPTPLVQEMLDQLPLESFTDPTKTYLDPSCGDGQFLSEVLIRKMENGSTFEQALSTIYGVDLMMDNVLECRSRLLCGMSGPLPLPINGCDTYEQLVKKNIVCHDALTYDYSFNGWEDGEGRAMNDAEVWALEHGMDEAMKSDTKIEKPKKEQTKPDEEVITNLFEFGDN